MMICNYIENVKESYFADVDIVLSLPRFIFNEYLGGFIIPFQFDFLENVKLSISNI